MSAIGYVTRKVDEKSKAVSYEGSLRFPGMDEKITIIPNGDKAPNSDQPDFRIYTAQNFELGAAWNRKGKQSGKPYVSLSISTPLLGKTVFANLGPAPGQSDKDVLAVIWNPPA